MYYRIQDGVLRKDDMTSSGEILASIQLPAFYTRKTILNSHRQPQLIANMESIPDSSSKKCRLLEPDGHPILTGITQCTDNPSAPSENLQIFCWNLITFQYQRQQLKLFMADSQNFFVEDPNGHTILTFTHRGIPGGWLVNAEVCFDPFIILGLFLFTRYLDKENEFITR